MASQGAMHNFSLPNRTGSRRPVSPVPPFSADGEFSRRCSRIDMGAFQLFRFTDDAAVSDANRRSLRALPRLMSTSSSAPALGGLEHPTPGGIAPRADASTFMPRNNAPPSPSPPMARPISVRWGPRLRHITMSEVQAADDAARRIAAARRERMVFWTLVAVALMGVLSCTAAVTLAAAQAALQAGLEDVQGEEGGGGGLVWDARTLGWLIASLVACAASAVGLAVATSVRCRRSRRSRTPTPPRSLSPAGHTATHKEASQEEAETENQNEAPKKTANRRSAPFTRRPDDGTETSGAWVEMRETGARRKSVADDDDDDDTPRWWRFGRAQEAEQCGLETGKEEAKSRGPTAKDSSGDGTANAPDEDRNWAKFSQDPVQLRRYVESLEARLTAGAQEAPVKPNIDASNASPKRIRIRPSTKCAHNRLGKDGGVL